MLWSEISKIDLEQGIQHDFIYESYHKAILVLEGHTCKYKHKRKHNRSICTQNSWSWLFWERL